jgi:hypothetical protein
MVEREGGQWNVAIKEKAVYVERVSEDNEQRFQDLLDPEAARGLARLLTKFADKLDDSDEESDDDSDGDSDD